MSSPFFGLLQENQNSQVPAQVVNQIGGTPQHTDGGGFNAKSGMDPKS